MHTIWPNSQRTSTHCNRCSLRQKRIRNKTTELRKAIDYADMVVDYVNNGSGTHDLIEKATAGLNEALKTVSDQMPQRKNEQ